MCDRCGDFFKIEQVRRGGDTVTDYIVVGVRCTIDGQTYDKNRLDLCPKCRKELNEWIDRFKLSGEVKE